MCVYLFMDSLRWKITGVFLLVFKAAQPQTFLIIPSALSIEFFGRIGDFAEAGAAAAVALLHITKALFLFNLWWDFQATFAF